MPNHSNLKTYETSSIYNESNLMHPVQESDFNFSESPLHKNHERIIPNQL